MTQAPTETLIRAFFDALNARDSEAVLELVAEDVVHDTGEGGREIGRERLRWFLAKRAKHFAEHFADIAVMTSQDSHRAAAEYTLRGSYLKTVEGLPPARGQSFSLSAGTFFDIDDGLISRVSTCYDLKVLSRQLEAHGG
ncbi:MAG: ketosteroid isomerase-related protein [Pseudomonadota bacterium]